MELNEMIAQRDALEAQIKATQTANRAAAITSVLDFMKTNGLSTKDLQKRAVPSGRKVAIKFSDGKGNSWSGRGQQPVWLRDALAAGASIDSFRVAG